MILLGNCNVKTLLIILMIINTNGGPTQSATINYIRNLPISLDISARTDEINESLQLSHSVRDSLNIKMEHSKAQHRKTRLDYEAYVSPYKQDALSIKKIMKSGKKSDKIVMSYRDLLIPESKDEKQKSKAKRKYSSPARYKQIPPLIDKFQQNEGDKMKVQARFLHQRELKIRNNMTNKQKDQKWADFLLRERIWQSEKNMKKQRVKQQILAREKEEFRLSIAPRDAQKMDIDEYAKLINRKKTRLKSQLKDQLLNYYSYHSPLRERQKSAKKSQLGSQVAPIRPSALSLRDRTIYVNTNKEITFLVNRNR